MPSKEGVKLASVSVSFTASNGIFSGTTTDGSDNIILASQSLRSTFSGDTSYWILTGSVPWTTNEDSVTAIVPSSGGENYLEGYADLTGNGFTEIMYRIVLEGDNADGTSNIQFTVTELFDSPSTAPTLSTSATGGSLSAAMYYVKYTWSNANGETMASPESSITTTGSTSTITVTIPSLPTGITNANIYISTTSDSETKQSNTTSTTYTQSAALVAGSALPSNNTATVTIINTDPNLPSGNFGPQQFSFTATADVEATIQHVTLELFVHAGSTITASNGELIPLSGGSPTASVYGTWTSSPVDLWKLANNSVTETKLDNLTQFGFYYNDLSNVDSANNTAHSISVLSNFTALVCNEPGLNTTSRQQFVQQALVSAGVKLYGYANLGIAESEYNGCIPPVSATTAIIDRCASNGYVGVFLDGAGQPGAPMEQLNYIVNYAHAKNPALSVFANSHPQDILQSTVNTTTLTAPTTAPSVSAVTDLNSTLPAGTYDVAYTLTSYDGETTASPVSSVTITTGQGISVSTISGFDNNAQGVNLYLSIAAGSSTLGLSQKGNGFAVTIESLPQNGAPNPPSTNIAYSANPNGLVCALSHGDWCLWESFYSRSDNQYAGVPEGGFINVFNEYSQGMPIAAKQGVRICGEAYQLNSIQLTNYSDWINAYVLASTLGFNGLAYSSSLSSTSVPWATPPTFPPLGNYIITPMQSVSANTYEATTDTGIIQFTAVDSPVSRSYAAFADNVLNEVTITSSPNVIAGRYSTTYQVSNDQKTWKTVTSSDLLAGVTQRYLIATISMHS